MAEAKFRIYSYEITYCSESYQIIPHRNIRISGKLECYCRQDDRCTIYFLPDDEVAAAPYYIEAEKHGFLFFSYREMPAIIDLLRNEKPVFATFTSDPLKSCNLSSNREPVGEEES